MRPPRRVRWCQGAASETRAAAARWVEGRPAVAWVGAGEGRTVLGRTLSGVVLDLHQGLDADTLARVQGAITAGGELVLRVPLEVPVHAALAAWPYERGGHRLWDRVTAGLERLADEAPAVAVGPSRAGTADQRAVVEALGAFLRGEDPHDAVTLVADRGRGKSSAIGLALAEAEVDVVLTGPGPVAVAEVIRFAGRGRWVPPHQVPAEARLVVVDEAAQLPIPVLQRLVERVPAARWIFATTVGGYEGTGRGFALRFGQWLAGVRRAQSLSLSEPIRWAPGDRLEAAVRELLCLDATPAPTRAVAGAELGTVRLEVVDRDRLVAEPQRLRDVFGLLMHAHYRTTPGDLHRMLDAPNLALHAAWHEDRCVGACLVAEEGGLPPELCDAIAFGGRRLRGHALPETLMCHAGAVRAGTLRMVRSVRIAVHPTVRRRGLARALVEHVHQTYDPDLFGTLFGAVPEVIGMRRGLGYELVRVGASRGSRTGEPTAVMVRPCTPETVALVEELRAGLSREWPVQQELLRAEGWPALPAYLEALGAGLGEPSPWSEAELDRIRRQFATGPRPYESCAAAIAHLAARHPPTGHADDAVLRIRVASRGSWERVAERAGLPSVPAAMRAVKRAVRAWEAT